MRKSEKVTNKRNREVAADATRDDEGRQVGSHWLSRYRNTERKKPECGTNEKGSYVVYSGSWI